jgi:radical SAM superfamily enzyme YgiQ (UPF0313 family)
MNILLIEPPFYLFQGTRGTSASYGLTMLAAVVSGMGHEVRVYAPDLEYPGEPAEIGVVSHISEYDKKAGAVTKRLREIITSFSPDVVGLSLLTARSGIGMHLAKTIRMENRDIITIAGGIHATMFPEKLLASGLFDYVVRGEGEVSFSKLVQGIARGALNTLDVPGLSYRDENDTPVHKPAHSISAM